MLEKFPVNDPAKSGPKVFDVVRPGRTLASPTSRPVIVGHKPKVQDSTLTGKPTDEPRQFMTAPDDTEIMSARQKITIQPPASSEDEQPEASTTNGASDQPETPASDTAPDHPEMPTTTEVAIPEADAPEAPNQPAIPSESKPSEFEPAAESEAAQSEPQSNEQPAEPQPAPVVLPQASANDEAAKHLMTHAPMPTSEEIGAQQIVVSHHGKNLPWSRSLLIVVVVLLVAAIVIDIGLDAKLWHASLPHTHFIN